MESFINRLKTGNPIRLPTHLRYGSKDEEVTVVPAEKKTLSSTVPSNSESDLATSESRLANSKKPKILLVIDSPETDWSAIFKDRTLHEGVYDIRVEQAQFCDLNLASYSDTGTMVDIQVYRAGTVVVRSFRPDFVLVRQHVRGIGPKEDWRNILLGLMFGNVPSVNSLSSIYNFAEKPWVFAQLIQIQKKLGKDVFPLIEQAYYPNHKEMLITPRFPVVVKVGHANSGYGKVCIQNHRSFQDIASVVALCDCYATTEPFIPGKCDIRIQKIGDDYRVFKRTSISDNWKTNTGSAMLEEIELTDSYKLWADECSKMFGGLDILCVEAIQGKNKKEYIIEVNDTAMRLFHETLDEDHKRIADLVIKKMEKAYPPVIQATTPTAAVLSGAFNVISAPGSQTATAAVSEDKKESSDKGWKKNGLFSGIID